MVAVILIMIHITIVILIHINYCTTCTIVIGDAIGRRESETMTENICAGLSSLNGEMKYILLLGERQ
jgi:hypothetical protein